MFKKLFSKGKQKIISLTVVFFSMIIVVLGVTPNYTCGCGEIENGTKLTFLINQVSKNVIGKPVFNTKKNPVN